jgi:hypothetical protein
MRLLSVRLFGLAVRARRSEDLVDAIARETTRIFAASPPRPTPGHAKRLRMASTSRATACRALVGAEPAPAQSA